MIFRTLFASALLATSIAASAAVGVSPLHLHLSATQHATGIYLTNASPEAGSFQITIQAWTQKDGKDVLSPTSAVVASPSIVSIPAEQRQVIRILNITPVPPGSAFRVIVQQLPTPADAKKGGLVYLLAYSLPLFVAAPAGSPSLTWKQAPGCHWTVSNSSSVAARITAVSVNGKAVVPGLLGYVLAGSSMDFHPAHCSQGQISAQVNGQPYSAAGE